MNWFGIPGIFYWAGPAILVITIIQVYKRGRKGMWRLGLKEASSSLISMVGLIWCMFMILLLVYSLPPITTYLEVQALKLESEDARWLLEVLPLVYALTGVGFIVWVLRKTWSDPVKYNEEEQKLRKEERAKLEAKFGWFGKLLR